MHDFILPTTRTSTAVCVCICLHVYALFGLASHAGFQVPEKYIANFMLVGLSLSIENAYLLVLHNLSGGSCNLSSWL